MTLADIEVITAEVKVDETDIVNVKMGQSAEVSVDAIPKKKFKGHVTEIGDQALLRSTGVADLAIDRRHAGSQGLQGRGHADEVPEVCARGSPPRRRSRRRTRPVLSIPIQALTIRQKGDLDSEEGRRYRPLRHAKAGRS